MNPIIVDFVKHSKLRAGENRFVCPSCSPLRKAANQKEETLSVRDEGDKVVFHCWHCDEKGAIFRDADTRASRPERVAPPKPPAPVQGLEDLSPDVRRWLNDRRISDETIAKLRIKSAWMPDGDGVAWPHPNGVKVQSIHKDERGRSKRRVMGTLDHFMGIERLDHSLDHIVICEGEADYASLIEAGVQNVISLPHGGVNPGSTDDNSKFACLQNDFEIFKGKKRIVLATDGDPVGDATAEALARRLSKGRCYRVSYPSDTKDSNEVLVRHGHDALCAVINEASPIHIPGLSGPREYEADLLRFRRGETGQGYSTGIETLDRYFTLAPSNVTVATGHPGCGKSEIVDWFHYWAMEHHGWSVGAWSSENPPHLHVGKMLQKKIGKPFLSMTDDEIEAGMAWLDGKFAILNQDEDPTIDSILERMSGAVLRYGIRSCVIDPFNEIILSGSQREDKEIAEVLGKVTRWAKSHDCHVFFVAHPRNLSPDEIPKGHHIAGGAPWKAKADFGLTVHRPEGSLHSEVHIWKVRHSWLGQLGSCEVRFDPKTGWFFDPLNEIQEIERKPRYSLLENEDPERWNLN